MRRWIWILMFAVIYDSGTWRAAPGYNGFWTCENDQKDACEDIVHAFNDAHQWRTMRDEPTEPAPDSAPINSMEEKTPLKLEGYPCPCTEGDSTKSCVCTNPDSQ